MLKAKDLRDNSPEELKALESEKRKELFDLVNRRAREKKMDDPSSLRVLKKDIARILTVLRERSGA
jgi:large subunit ribosomal protein L29